MEINLTKSRVSELALNLPKQRAVKIVSELFAGNEAMTGWVGVPKSTTEETISAIEKKAAEFKEKCTKCIVIGIGGSYLGAAAVVHALGGSKPGYPELRFAGHNLSGASQLHAVQQLRDNETCLCMVSKSGSTMEPMIAFSILRDELVKKYGEEEAAKRIVVITDAEKGPLRAEARQKGYASFTVPDNIGGRYSVLTAASLFPLAVAGVDIRAMLNGAAEIADEKAWCSEELQPKLMDYALTRYSLLNKGKELEIFEYYDPSMRYFGEWIKQLFAESEGKEGRGLFPVSLTLSTDLHSIGQYLQEGRQFFFETVINVTKKIDDVTIPESAGPLGGMSLNDINQKAVEGVVAAHSKADIPVIQITLPVCDAYNVGQLMYFFEMTAAITAKLMRVDPFTQDGVEAYKHEIKRLLGI